MEIWKLRLQNFNVVLPNATKYATKSISNSNWTEWSTIVRHEVQLLINRINNKIRD